MLSYNISIHLQEIATPMVTWWADMFCFVHLWHLKIWKVRKRL